MHLSSRRSISLASLLVTLAVACSSTVGNNNNSSGGGGSGGGGQGGGGGTDDACPQAKTLLDVGKAPGAGESYPAPTLTGACTADHFVVDSNAIPHYNFVQTTPNPLVAQPIHYEIPLKPEIAPTTTELPLLGPAGFAVNGMPFFGPNEGPQPVDSAWGDPVYNGLMDPCLGHTAFTYHYHSMLEQCLVPSGLVAEPWTNAAPDPKTASPILGWALDGFPIYGSRECKDASCAEIVMLQSGYSQIADPKTNAWDAYAWAEHPNDPSYLDECNGHYGPDGDYHYHVTASFPYIIGCYRGTPIGAGGGGGTQGPKACASAADCAPADCPPGSVGCTCGQTPMGMACIPTCNVDADCPLGPMGMPLSCKGGVCGP